MTATPDDKATPTGVARPAPLPPRARHTTQHDLQTASQEISAEGLVPTEEAIAARAAYKRTKRVERKVTWMTVAQTVALVLVLKGDEIVAWSKAHQETAGGLGGLLGILVGGYLLARRLGPWSRGDDEGPGRGPPSGDARP